MLVDTDVLIWYMRGNYKAKKAIDKITQPVISIVTHMELVQGSRNKDEQSALNRFFDNRGVTSLPVTATVSQRALFLMEEWYLSHGLLIADALIAATALDSGLPLLTANDKHYRFLSNIRLSRFRP